MRVPLNRSSPVKTVIYVTRAVFQVDHQILINLPKRLFITLLTCSLFTNDLITDSM